MFTPAFRARSRAELGVRPGSFHLLFAGRIQRLKGPQVFVEAAGILRKRRPDIDLELTILGALSGAKDFNLQSFITASGSTTSSRTARRSRRPSWRAGSDLPTSC
ncbi:D-inositol 3-phosphate glycosyltransferase [Arthrobacter sp. Hiyo1]|nr:D-inositol 3-phosphate glycosyltransferase [Arthrobacter sp. Hiyo1]